MWLLLTEPADPSAAWLAEGLAQRTHEPVEHLTSTDLHEAATMERHEGPNGPWFCLVAADGRTIDSRRVRGVINRLWALPPGLAGRMNLPDRRHVVRSFTRPILRCLSTFPGPVLNRPLAQGLSGDYRVNGEWCGLADRIGFMSAPETLPPESRGPGLRHTQVVVVGTKVIPLQAHHFPVSSTLAERCLRLAEAAQADLLGIEALRLWPNNWRFVTASFWPDLRIGGAHLLDTLMEEFVFQVRSPRGPPCGEAIPAVCMRPGYV